MQKHDITVMYESRDQISNRVQVREPMQRAYSEQDFCRYAFPLDTGFSQENCREHAW